MAEERYNRKNPSVKRILQEVREMQSNPSDDFVSLPLEEDIFEWQFAIRGPCDSEFEGGIYHGRIKLPAEYPLKPPSFMLLTPSGRFETQTKICLSISNYHPEHWQPSWSVRTALVALIAFMPTSAEGALGSLEYKKEERRALAIKSRQAPPKYGNQERQKLIDEIHQYMLSKSPPVPELPAPPTTEESTNTPTDEAIQAADPNSDAAPDIDNPNSDLAPRIVEGMHEVRVDAAAGPLRVRFSARVSLSRRPAPESEGSEQAQRMPATVRKRADDRIFNWAAIGLIMAILFLVAKKFLKSSNFAGYTDGI